MQARFWFSLGMLCPSLACSSGSEPGAPLGAGGSTSVGEAGTANRAASSGASAGPGGGTSGALGGGASGMAGRPEGGSSGGATGAAGNAGGALPAAAGTGGVPRGGSAGSSGTGFGAGAPGVGGAAPSEPGGPVYDYGAAVENTSADCPVPTLAEPSALPSIPKLPDPFEKIDGTTLTARSEWHCRRQEILKQAEKYIYGTRPGKPDSVTGSVTTSKVTVHVEALGKSIDFSANIKLPSTGSPPYPAIINVGASGITLGEARVLEQGVAVIYYNHNELGREGQAEQSRGDPNPGKFYDLFGGTHSAGLLQAWSWGASRLVDVLQASDKTVIDPTRLGVTGCSRNGKGAFTVGLFDERIALTIPHETSTGGVPAYRIVDVLNTERTDHNYFGLNWLSNDFEPFVYKNGTSNAVKLPIDTHSLIGSMAPRGLLILENPHQTQMSAPAGHTAAVAGRAVYEALGVAANISYHSSVAETPHCSYKAEYTELLVANIRKFLKHEGAETGQFLVGRNGSLALSDWKAWDAPPLAE